MAYTGDLGFDYGDYSVNPGGFTYPTGDFSGGFSMGDLGVNYEDYNVNNPFAKAQSGGGFFDQFGRFIGFANKAIPGIARTVSAVKDITNPQDSPGIFNPDVTRKSKEEIDKERVKTLGDIQAAFTRIAGTTGISSQDAVKGYLAEFGPALDKITAQGRFDLEKDPDISKQYAQLNVRIPEIQEQYSALNNPRFAAAYKAPDAVASVDINKIEEAMKLGPAYKAQYSYDDPESLRLIEGDIYRPKKISEFYASDPNLNSFMVSATDPTVQDLTRYS